MRASGEHRSIIVALAVWWVLVIVDPVRSQWPQWGGPERNFTVETTGLADSWPEDGPRKLWRRTLGLGYSSIVHDDGMLYTMYRKDRTNENENTIALDAGTGRTVWERANRAPVPGGGDDSEREFCGPNATPLVVGDRLYTVGRNARIHCYQKTDGTILWQHDLVAEYGAGIPASGYSCSPISYRNTVIVAIGRAEEEKGRGSSLIAFEQATGRKMWSNHEFTIWHSSPILIKYAGEEQLVLHTKEGLIGVNPRSGDLLWRHAFEDPGIITTPVWNGTDTLFCSSLEVGMAVRLTREGGTTRAQRLWSSRNTALGMGTPILIDDVLVGSRAGSMTAPIIAADVTTGRRVWHQRGFPGASLVYGDGKLVVLDNTGLLGLATVGAKGLNIHSEYKITEKWSFTPPTLVGTTLYVRDERAITALDVR
ncbi:MAG: PQQ-binding-like beta-propeller repeat protein [Phycisphaerales bacterium]|nr:MAG: PQQ-binding-like beta-propeller repeat protein [Phycisphaerales bacterium]